ncbi:MAG: hypothetical protein AAFN78_08260 [Pseudomonadota bacterium]
MRYALQIRLLAAVFFVLPATVWAQDVSVPNTFSPGTTIRSAEMNENFSALESGVNANNAQLATIDEELQSVVGSVDDLAQRVDANGDTLAEISSELETISETLTSIDAALASANAATPSDQLICAIQPAVIHLQTQDLMKCVRASTPNGQQNLSLSEIFQDGWVLISAGGDSTVSYIFHKYESADTTVR